MPRVNVNAISEQELFFKDTDGALLRARHFHVLVARVAAYRERNGRPIGSPTEEIHAQLAERNPGVIRAGVRIRPRQPGKNAPPALKHGQSLKGRALGWLEQIRKRKDEISIVRDSDRNARVNICAGCPFNQSVTGGCGSCKSIVAEQRNEIIGRRAVDKRLGGCEILGEELTTSTWLDEPVVENPNLPAHCWRRRSV